jgi:hypothetical protein
MAQWLRRPTVTTNSNREIRSSILRGGVSFLRSFATVVRSTEFRICIGGIVLGFAVRAMGACSAGAKLPHISSFERVHLILVPQGSLFAQVRCRRDISRLLYSVDNVKGLRGGQR